MTYEEKTLRDEFAMAAMAVVARDWKEDMAAGFYEDFANDCYAIADSMLMERVK